MVDGGVGLPNRSLSFGLGLGLEKKFEVIVFLVGLGL